MPEEPVVTLKLSSMQAAHLLNVLSRTICETSSENGHIKMTIMEIEEEFERLKSLRKDIN